MAWQQSSDTFVGSACSFVFFIPATAANDLLLRRISIPDLIHYIIFLSHFLKKRRYFPFQCRVQNKGTTGTIFITSLLWRGPWLGIEPGDLPYSKPAHYHYAIEEAVDTLYWVYCYNVWWVYNGCAVKHLYCDGDGWFICDVISIPSDTHSASILVCSDSMPSHWYSEEVCWSFKIPRTVQL